MYFQFGQIPVLSATSAHLRAACNCLLTAGKAAKSCTLSPLRNGEKWLATVAGQRGHRFYAVLSDKTSGAAPIFFALNGKGLASSLYYYGVRVRGFGKPGPDPRSVSGYGGAGHPLRAST